jgi:hypothetical protein
MRKQQDKPPAHCATITDRQDDTGLNDLWRDIESAFGI